MATLLQCKQMLVEQSGMTGLVTDAEGADYTDKAGLLTNATYYINEGIKYLNQLYSMQGTKRRHVVDIASGTYQISVPYVDFIYRIDLVDEDGKRQNLQYQSLDFMRGYYNEPYGSLTAGQPWDWAWNVTNAQTGVAGTYDVADLAVTNDRKILMLPPADRTYTIHIFGDFSTADLSSGSDTNWWTVNWPRHVVRAARIQLEIDGHRNISGYEAFRGVLEADIQLLLCNDRFAYIAGLSPEEAVQNG